MELKPPPEVGGNIILTSFNRTSMELKLDFHPRLYLAYFAFNRTSMELKLTLRVVPDRDLSTFNRTSMELKHVKPSCCVICSAFAFNRTSMELKPGFHLFLDAFFQLLIEPVWN